MTTRRLWRALALSIGLSATLGAGLARAQTVIVRNATPRAQIELVLNADRVATATANTEGLATLFVDPTGKAKPKDTDAHLFVDTCGNLIRVLLVEVGHDAPAVESMCQRSGVPDLFAVRAVTTMVVEPVAGRSPIVLIRQGAAPDEWIHQGAGGLSKVRGALPVGFVVFGGGSGVRFSNFVSTTCGDVTSCSGSATKVAATGGATLWVNRFLGVEGTFTKVTDAKSSGSGTVSSSGANYSFNSVLQTRLLTIVGKAAVNAGPVRIYGMAGADHMWATSSTTQIVNAAAPAPGGTETFEAKTAGWGFVFGGGAEAWFNRRFGIYAEGGRAALKGTATDSSNGTLDDHLTFITVGVRVHVFGG